MVWSFCCSAEDRNVPAVLETADDGADEATLDTIRLDGDEAVQGKSVSQMNTHTSTRCMGSQPLALPEQLTSAQ